MQRVVFPRRLRATPRDNFPERFDLSRLETGRAADFQVALQNRFKGLQETATQERDDGGQSLKSSLQELSNTHSAKTQPRNQDWVMGNILSLVDDCCNTRAAGSPLHRELRPKTIWALRSDRNAHWMVFAEETENAAARGDSRTLYRRSTVESAFIGRLDNTRQPAHSFSIVVC